MAQASAIYDEETCKIIEEIPAPLIKYLVFEGGGVRGLAYRDVIIKLKEAGILDHVEHVAGSSIGAIAAMMLALGYTDNEEEIKEILGNLSFKAFLEDQPSWSFTPDLIIRGIQYLTIFLTENHSLSTGELLEKWLEDRVEKVFGEGKRRATFAMLDEKVKNNAVNNTNFKYLSVTGSNLTKNRVDIFNHETTPNMPIALAVRISAAFPTVFKAVEWDDGQGVCLYIDGGVMQNLPYFVFNQQKYLPKGFNFTEMAANPAILNIKIDTAEEVAAAWNLRYEKIIKSFTAFSKAVLDGMQSHDREIFDQFATNTLQVFDHNIYNLKWDLEPEAKELLFEAGREAATEWIENHYAEAYKIKTYDSEEAWLQAKTDDQLVELLTAYSDLYERSKYTDTQEALSKLADKINWLEVYIVWRKAQTLHNNATHLSKIGFPQAKDLSSLDKEVRLFIQRMANTACPTFTPHVNLPAVKPRKRSDFLVKREMRNKLRFIQTKIKFLDLKIREELERIVLHNRAILHDNYTYDHVVYATQMQEDRKILKEKERDLFIKLNIPIEEFQRNTFIEPYNQFVNLIEEVANNKACFCPLVSNLYRDINARTFPFLCEDNFNLYLDLHQLADLKVYALALCLYLSCTPNHLEAKLPIFAFYRDLFETDVIPKNIESLGELLGLGTPKVFLSAYKIERLLNHFMQVDNPKAKLSYMNLDLVFDAFSNNKEPLKNVLMLKQPQNHSIKEKGDVELNYLYQSFTSKEKFLMFHNSDSEGQQFFSERPFANNSSKATNAPKCYRRFE